MVIRIAPARMTQPGRNPEEQYGMTDFAPLAKQFGGLCVKPTS